MKIDEATTRRRSRTKTRCENSSRELMRSHPKLETVNGFFKVLYSPRSTDPMHGFLFQRRFACQEEAELFSS